MADFTIKQDIAEIKGAPGDCGEDSMGILLGVIGLIIRSFIE